MAVLGTKMLWKLAICYLIFMGAACLHLYPTCAIFSSLKKTWERSVLSCNVLSIGNHEKNAHFHLYIALLIGRNSVSGVLLFCTLSLSKNQSRDNLVTFSALQDSILNLILNNLLDPRLLRLGSRLNS